MPESPTFDPRIQTENIAFDPGSMVTCEACGRTSPPNRLKCLYCAKELSIDTGTIAAVKPSLRKLEMWERGFNLIVRERMPRSDTTAAAKFLGIDPDDVTTTLDIEVPVPIARVENETEASVVQERLAQFGIACSIVSDRDLASDKLPVRLSAMEFADRRLLLTDFNTSEVVDIDADHLVLIVPGTVIFDRVDSLEKKGRGKKTKLVDETATASDEMLLDIYARHDATGYRVHLTGFDFSCLGEDKGLLAGENMRLLVVRLAEHLPNAKLVNDYTEIRHVLDRVWEIESRKDSRGLRRSGLGKIEVGSTASSSNLDQFTRYSRLQWHLL